MPAVGLDPDGAGGEGDPVAVAALLREPRESDTAALPVTGTGGLPVPVGIYRAGYGIVTSRKQRRSRRQLPAQPGPGGHALDGGLRGGTGHGPVPLAMVAPSCGLTSRGSADGTFPPGGPGTGWREIGPGRGV